MFISIFPTPFGHFFVCLLSEMTMIDCRFKGHGYENGGIGKTPKDALEGLKKDAPHNDVMLNKGVWAKFSWGSVGAAFLRDPSRNEEWTIAPLWFAEEPDNSTC